MSDSYFGMDLKARLGSRQPPAGRDTLFASTAEFFYEQDKTVAQYSRRLGLSTSTMKRIVSYLRLAGVVQGRLPSLHFDLSLLYKEPLGYSSAIVGVESDLERLRELSRSRTQKPYSTEEQLMLWICNHLPRTESYKGKIIVEKGFIVMGSGEFTMIILVHSISSKSLFDFVRLAVERSDGVRRAHTMMVAFAS